MYYLNFSKICQEKNSLSFREETETQLTEKTDSRSHRHGWVSADVGLQTIETRKQSKDLSQIQSYKCLGFLKY